MKHNRRKRKSRLTDVQGVYSEPSSVSEELKRLQDAFADALEKNAEFESQNALLRGQFSSAERARAELSLLSQELKRLQDTFAEALERGTELERQNVLLREELSQEKAACRRAKAELSKAQKTLAFQMRQISALERRNEQLQRKYDALSNSKLGRLTLYFWSKQASVPKEKRGLPFSRLLNRLFNRIPTETAFFPVLETQSEVRTPNPLPENVIDVSWKAETSAQTLSPVSAEQPLPNVPDTERPHWIDRYVKAMTAIPESNGCRFYERVNLKIGLICDAFFYESIEAAAWFVYVTPENWREQLERQHLDAFLFVTAWRGLHNEWAGLAYVNPLGKESEKRKKALELLDYCHAQGIPTIFYSKEDPPNYAIFLDYAKQCDYIFTSARECAPYYKEDCGNDNVRDILFCVNPQRTHPIGFYRAKKEKLVLFSGSWMKKYPTRCKELSEIFDGVLASEYRLHIIDRNYPANSDYFFPEPYFSCVSEALGHQDLQKIHKLFNWAVNVNSVKGSETMFANRAFELEANGVLLLSNYSVGMNSLLPNVTIVHQAEDIPRILNGMSPEEIYERQLVGVRAVMTGHTCYERLAQFLAPCGLRAEQPQRSVLVIANRLTKRVTQNFERQTYPYKRLVERKRVTDELLNAFDMVAWFGEQSDYGVFYLEDMANGFKYTACDYITKDAYVRNGELQPGVEHGYVRRMGDKFRTLFWRAAYAPKFLLNLSGGTELENGYSIDHFSYCEGFAPKSPRKAAYALSVITPVYNNGAALYAKCFSSLRRSSLFEDMEVILVDDGSTDERTLRIEEDLLERFPNVRLYRFEKGGSGSASRPRNKGVELASAQYIAFLDPDNEAICDGFARMYRLAIEENRDLVVGNMYRYRDETEKRLANNYAQILLAARRDSFDDGFGDNLRTAKFFAASIQAMVIRKRMITDNGLTQVEGAVGQDTLFSWQLLQTARRIRAVDIPIHVYYAQTAGSVTNVVGPKFFERLLLLQKPKRDWLKEQGLLADFMKSRYDYYTTAWVLKKLLFSRDTETCVHLVEQYLALYADGYRNTSPLINDFLACCEKRDYTGAIERVKKEFPASDLRPMPALEQILEERKKPSEIDVSCAQDGNRFTFRNLSGEDSAYAWVVLLASGKYQKVYSTKYSSNHIFRYDFSQADPQTYKVRAFIKGKDGRKKSQDVAFIRRTDDGASELLLALSTVTVEKEEISDNGHENSGD